MMECAGVWYPKSTCASLSRNAHTCLHMCMPVFCREVLLSGYMYSHRVFISSSSHTLAYNYAYLLLI